MTTVSVIKSSPLGRHRDEDLRPSDGDPTNSRVYSTDAVMASTSQSLKPRQIIAARTPDALQFSYSTPSPDNAPRFTTSGSPPSIDLAPSASCHLPAVADVGRDVMLFPDRLPPPVNGTAGTPTRDGETLMPFTVGAMFKNDFRFLDSFAERSRGHPFGGGVGGSPMNDRKRKLDSAVVAERQRGSYGVKENGAAESKQPDMMFQLSATTSEVDPLSALLRRYGTSSDLLSSLQRSASSSMSTVAEASPTRQLQQPASSFIANNDDQRPTIEHNNGGLRQQHLHHQQATVFEGEDSRSGHGNTLGGGGADCTGAESTVSSGMTGSSSERTPPRQRDVVTNENGEKNYYCHMCSYMGTSHSDYLSHTSSHFRHRCNLCDYMSTTAGRLKRHLHECHVIPAKGDDNVVAADVLPVAAAVAAAAAVTAASAPGSSTSSGSSAAAADSRKKKCRKCEFQTTDQDEFYEHARTHIRPDRIIECPMCRFATQYRHHLELHLRNHLGSKPHQCPNCDYCCPVASMLASHMKSHSRVNRYRCAECNFSTKFSNALKRHLLAKDHEYGIVLNDDGSLPPEGPQRFYPNSTSARRRRGAGRGAWVTFDRPNTKPPSPVQTVGTGSDHNVVVPMTRFSADDANRLMTSINSSGAMMMSPMMSPEVAQQSVMVKQEDVRNYDVENKAAGAVQVAPPAPQRYHHDQTGSGYFNIDRLRCLVCGFPARSVTELTHHLMTSHGLPTTGGNTVMSSSPKKPRLEPTGSSPNYFRKRVDEEDRKFDDVKLANQALTHARTGDGRFYSGRAPMLPMWSGPSARVSTPSALDGFRGSSGMNLIRQQFEDNLNQLSLSNFNQSPMRLDDHVTLPYRNKPSPIFEPRNESVHHTSPQTSSVPLDLSAKSTSTVMTPQVNNMTSSERNEDTTSSSAAAAKRSRRKGRAFKIDTSAILNESIEEPVVDDCLETAVLGASFFIKATVDQSEPTEFNTGNGSGLPEQIISSHPRMNPPKKNPALRPISPAAAAMGGLTGTVAKSPGSTDEEKLNGSTIVDGELFECLYCGLGFRDRTLHLMHMEFHDLRPGSDPFQCKLCGQQTADQLEFFLHIARAPHLTTKVTSSSSSDVVRNGSRLVSAIS